MKTIISLVLLILFLSNVVFVLYKAETYSLSKRSKRMVRSRKETHWNKIVK